MTKTNYPWLFLLVDWFCLAGIVSFFTFAPMNIKNWAHGNILHWSRCPWDDADMLREPVRTCGRLYEGNRCNELGEWLDDQDVCLLLNISPYFAFFWVGNEWFKTMNSVYSYPKNILFPSSFSLTYSISNSFFNSLKNTSFLFDASS